MKVQSLGEAVNLASVANQTAVNFGLKTPFLAGRKVLATIDYAPDATAAGTSKIQGSEDGTTYVDLLTSTTLSPKKAMVTCYQYMRYAVTIAGTGAASAHLESGT
jgi:hypothetical protein